MEEFSELHRYRIVRTMAVGGMGSVSEAILCGAQGFEKRVAVKSILPEYSGDPEFIRRFVGEAKLVADLIHPNIVQLYALGKNPSGQYYVVMEYIDGMDLGVFRERHEDDGKRIPVEIAAFMVSRICRALDYAHSKRSPDGVPLGIVHRDISPGNILITTEGEVKLADFGVARARTEYLDAADGDRVGKIGYFSPEQITGRGADARSDLFSLGVVLYQLLTMELPFPAGNLHQATASLLSVECRDPAELNPEVPEDLAQITLKALEKDPDFRYKSAGEMLYAIEYHMYHDRYGPTTQALAAYLREMFPDLQDVVQTASCAASTVRMDYQ